MARPALLALDWGSTSFRAHAVAENGAVLETRSADLGITKVSGGDFVGALRGAIGDWLAPGRPLLLAGMITSRNGWVETPYVPVPASPADIVAAIVPRVIDGLDLSFLPGVAVQRADRGDVMRGEEAQLIGAGIVEGTVVLPGTHSKWARLAGGRIVDFTTFPTGEIFALLRHQSLLGRLAEGETIDDSAFLDGVLRAKGGGMLSHLFAARAETLLGMRAAASVHGYLSGLLIGAELEAGVRLEGVGEPLHLIGNPALVARYGRAASALGLAAQPGPDDAALQGLLMLARARGLLCP